jgi:hypothetical protein
MQEFYQLHLLAFSFHGIYFFKLWNKDSGINYKVLGYIPS